MTTSSDQPMDSAPRRKVVIPPEAVERIEPARGGDPEAALRLIETLASAMDDGVMVPGLNVKVPLDPVIGLIPGLGDVISAAVSGIIILKARDLKVSRVTLARMTLNAGFDALIGAVPLLGDLFDLGFKANKRNLRLLKKELARRK